MNQKTALTEAEWKIIKLLWDKSPLTMMEITRALEEATGWTKNTVTTLLKRMIQKGTVAIDETGGVKHYLPKVDKEKVTREQTDTLLKRLFSGKASLLVTNLVERGNMTDEEIHEIMKILEGTSKE
jgi:BlaI family penicillinase repressor